MTPTPPNCRWRVYVGNERKCRALFPTTEVRDAEEAAEAARRIYTHLRGTTLRVEHITSNGPKTTYHAPVEAAA